MGLPLRRAAVLLAALGLSATASAGAEPAPGHYAARLCVSLSAQPPNCGAMAAEVRGAGVVLLRYSDIVYELALHSSQIDVLLRQGPIHLDRFIANYGWQGGELRFFDAGKKVGYAVQFGERAR